jgi:acetyl-CoA synthetase
MLPDIRNYQELRTAFRWQIPPRYNIGVDACDKWAAQDPGRTALLVVRTPGDILPFSYGTLREQSNRLANTFAAHGIARGDRVAIILPQAPETAVTHIAVYKLGAIAVPLAALFGVDALAYRLENSGASAVVTNHVGLAKIAEIRDRLPALKLILCIDGAGDRVLGFHETIARASADFSPVQSAPDEPALMVYTSGTTGQPKGALHAHRVLLGHFPGVEFHHEFFPQPGDCMWTPADWAWAGGLLNVLLPGLLRRPRRGAKDRQVRPRGGLCADGRIGRPQYVHPADRAAHAARRGQAETETRLAHSRFGRRIAGRRDL